MNDHSEQTPRYVVGVDGGGTKTEVLLERDGQIVGQGTSGSSNYLKIGFAAAANAISDAIRAAFADAGLPPSTPAVYCLGLAGIDRDEDQRMWEEWFAEYAPGAVYSVVNDCELGLAAGTPDDIGLAVVCGTGAICFGRNQAGEMARADGWGYILGDDGSGYSIGLAAMRAILCEYDGRGPATSLTARVLEHWDLADPEGLLVRVYLEKALPAEIAALAKIVAEEAAAGDEVALSLLRCAGEGVARTMAAVARRLRLENPIPCALIGGVITKGAIMAEYTMRAAAELGLELGPVQPVFRPADGAVRLARELLP